jgi:hypothetical protein
MQMSAGVDISVRIKTLSGEKILLSVSDANIIHH